MAYDSLLICKKCHTSMVIPKRVTVRKLTVYVWARCSHCKKETKFTLPLPQVHEWVDPVARNFFRCPKCGVTGVITRKMQGGDFTKLRLYCPSCQRAFAKVATNSIFSYLMSSHYNQMKPQPQFLVPMQAPGPQIIPPMSPPGGAQGGTVPPATAPAVHIPSPAATIPEQSSSYSHRCTNCNAVLTPNALFCRKCGVPVEAGVETAPRCPFCGATLSEKAVICPKCSSEVRCKNCNALLHTNARFCIKCGTPIKREGEEIEIPQITCHFCGAPLELDQKVCPECGKPTVCPNCGNHLKSGVKFCNKCGTNVSEITLAPSEEEAEEFDEDLESADNTIKCPECGAIMNAIYNFCTICGSKLEKENS
ncbi:MAG: double zinc ribbon domain-containing protein [Candidatus Helarchaeota archaeon]